VAAQKGVVGGAHRRGIAGFVGLAAVAAAAAVGVRREVDGVKVDETTVVQHRKRALKHASVQGDAFASVATRHFVDNALE